ncbi:hypothetical protein [Micromonospora musae]|uniref:hypothetical protein n=1 Tax=Micromonospora musae TaxID=1894970 RepID=UPI003430739B
MSYAVDAVFDEAARLLERELRRLQALDQARDHLSDDKFDSEGVAAMSRALTFVVCAGILEQLMRELPAALSSDICGLQVVRRRLPIGLLAILETADFRRCAEQNVSVLTVRSKLVKNIVAHIDDDRTVASFEDDLKLADGRTVGEKQFAALWDILGLPGDWRNDPKDLFLLKEIQQKRNSIAHWEQDPVAVGRMKSYENLQAVTRSLGLLLDHVRLHICEWLDSYVDVRTAPVP